VSSHKKGKSLKTRLGGRLSTGDCSTLDRDLGMECPNLEELFRSLVAKNLFMIVLV
jgi:hypothetical protein